MLRGHDPNLLANLSIIEEMFYSAIMQKHREEEFEKFNAMLGDGKR